MSFKLIIGVIGVALFVTMLFAGMSEVHNAEKECVIKCKPNVPAISNGCVCDLTKVIK